MKQAESWQPHWATPLAEGFLAWQSTSQPLPASPSQSTNRPLVPKEEEIGKH